MTRLTYFGSFLIAAALVGGSLLFSGSFVMTFASTSIGINIARIILMALMLALMLSEPPRSAAFRALLSMASACFVLWAFNYAMRGSVAIADSILFLHAALSFGIAALEPSTYHRGADAVAVAAAEKTVTA
jgi:hypothetical protein